MEAEQREKGLLLHLNRVLEMQKSAGAPLAPAAYKNAAESPALAPGQGAGDSPELGRLQAEVQRLKVKLTQERLANPAAQAAEVPGDRFGRWVGW